MEEIVVSVKVSNRELRSFPKKTKEHVKYYMSHKIAALIMDKLEIEKEEMGMDYVSFHCRCEINFATGKKCKEE